jgi:hypothetical protein
MPCDKVIQPESIMAKLSFSGHLHGGDRRMVTRVMPLPRLLNTLAQNVTHKLPPVWTVLLLTEGSPERDVIIKVM